MTAPNRRILLFGSSSLFASFPDAEPHEIGVAVTIDADFFIDPDDKTKVIATASSRFDKRFGRRSADRGMKDINTLVALITAGRLDGEELARQVRHLDHEPAMMVECANVMDTVIALAKNGKTGA